MVMMLKNWQLKMIKYKQSKKICNQDSNLYEFTDVNKFWNLYFVFILFNLSKCLNEFSNSLKKF